MRILSVSVLICLISTALWAQDETKSDETRVTDDAGTAQAPIPAPQTLPAPTVYTHAYEVRADIHKYASYATLPLYAAEFALGQSLFDDPGNGTRRSLHGAVGAGIIGLASVNTVTGAWNLWVSRHDTKGRKLRVIHSVLLMASDAGFVASWATAPSSHNRGTPAYNSDKVTHRNIAIASIGTGTVGYLIMIFGHH
jgi:hypothetical protein